VELYLYFIYVPIQQVQRQLLQDTHWENSRTRQPLAFNLAQICDQLHVTVIELHNLVGDVRKFIHILCDSCVGLFAV
jgi:hypothetical protein